jgi:class 3 adenylate cyclase
LACPFGWIVATVTAARVGRNVDDIRRALALAVEPGRDGDAAILHGDLALRRAASRARALRDRPEERELAAKLVDGVEPRTLLHDHALCACRAHLTEAAGTYAEAATLHAKASERWRESGGTRLSAPMRCSAAAAAVVTHPRPEAESCASAPWRRRRSQPSLSFAMVSCDHADMPRLGAKERAQLRDSAFAYIDSRGRRRLPIHDAAHVRNALARFSQVAFEDEDARDRARNRLLRAAQKHGIMPIGFIRAQLQPQRKLPKGHLTFLLTDIEGSTELLARLDDQYAPLLADVRRLVSSAVRHAGGHEVSARGDDVFAVFERAPAALEAALAIQRATGAGSWPENIDVRLRIGLHRGRPALTDTGYVGLSVHAAARICFAAHGGQIVMSGVVRTAVLESLAEGISLRSLGAWRFRGLPEPIELFQVDAADRIADFPPLRSAVPAK